MKQNITIRKESESVNIKEIVRKVLRKKETNHLDSIYKAISRLNWSIIKEVQQSIDIGKYLKAPFKDV